METNVLCVWAWINVKWIFRKRDFQTHSVVVYLGGSVGQDNNICRIMNTCAWPHNSTTCRTMQTHQIQQHVSGNTTLVEQNALAKQKLNSVATETLMSSNAPGWQSGPSALFDPQVPFFSNSMLWHYVRGRQIQVVLMLLVKYPRIFAFLCVRACAQAKLPTCNALPVSTWTQIPSNTSYVTSKFVGTVLHANLQECCREWFGNVCRGIARKGDKITSVKQHTPDEPGEDQQFARQQLAKDSNVKPPGGPVER